jgi:putative mRNA 3-end processing factor
LDLLTLTEAGLYCPAGDFHIDPWRPVPRAVITHAHADHARPGHAAYLAARDGEKALRVRLGPDAMIETLPYGENIDMNGVRVSLHPAGHVLGSAQVRIEYRGEVWVVSGDYRIEADRTCAAFEPVRCDAFVTESTFGLPVYRWRPQAELFAEIDAWWRANQEAGRASVLFAYAFGKAQRVLAGVDASIGPIVCHGAVEPLNAAYRASGVPLPRTLRVSEIEKGFDWSRALVIAPPSTQSTPWLRRFGEYSDGFASGWMLIRGARRRRAVDRGFALSDHADWPGLLSAIDATGATRIFVTHGQVAVMVRWLSEQGHDARAMETRFEGEQDGASAADSAEEVA